MSEQKIDLDALEADVKNKDVEWSDIVECCGKSGWINKAELDAVSVLTPSVVLELIRMVREAQKNLEMMQYSRDGYAEGVKNLETELAESKANDYAAMGWLAKCRFAVGDNGKRMLPEFVEYLKELKEKADKNA